MTATTTTTTIVRTTSAATFSCPECSCYMGKIMDENGQPVTRPVVCPDCHTFLNQNQPSMRYITCGGCSTMVSHNISDLNVECFHCHVHMELPIRLNVEQFIPRPVDRKKPGRKRIHPSSSSSSSSSAAAKKVARRSGQNRDPNRPKTARAMFIQDLLKVYLLLVRFGSFMFL